jgi:hypothetical protein
MLMIRVCMRTEEISHITRRWFCCFKPEVSENTVTFFRSILCLSLERGVLKNYTVLSMVYDTSNHSVFCHLSIVHCLQV